jgi:hypothetical protein
MLFPTHSIAKECLKEYTTLAKKNHGDLNAASEWITHAEDLDPEEEPTSENGKETTIS